MCENVFANGVGTRNPDLAFGGGPLHCLLTERGCCEDETSLKADCAYQSAVEKNGFTVLVSWFCSAVAAECTKNVFFLP